MRQILMLGLLLAGATAIAQEGPSPQQLFESGQNELALQRIAEQREQGAPPEASAYLAGQVLLKLNRDEEATHEFERLAASGNPILAHVGQSALALATGDNQRALDLANQAVAMATESAAAAGQSAALGPEHFDAYYQLGQVKARFSDWAGCAEAFHQAATLDPSFAYAHYYAGLSYSRVKRADRTSEHFERFLRLAPNAPERAAVESLMRTLRGR